jgi:hemerythrin
MSVGVATLDADHRCLVRIINLLEDVDDHDPRQTIDTVLETLLAYGRFHFRREEQVMEASGFPGAGFHRSEHQGFVGYMRQIHERCRETATPAMVQELRHYLTDWLLHHILIQDMAYKPYVEGVADMDRVARAAAPPVTLPADRRARAVLETLAPMAEG